MDHATTAHPNQKLNLCLLGFETLGLNVLVLHYVMLANHDQNV